MKKLTIIALLIIILVACAPVMPQEHKDDKDDHKDEKPLNETADDTEPQETEMPEEQELEETKVDTRDFPKKEVTEGDLVSFPNLKAVDPDGDPIDYTFSEPLNEKGEWQTEEGDAGEYVITITASDGTNTVSQKVLLVVNSKNKAPIIEITDPVEAKEGETLKLDITVTDPDGDNVTVTYTGWMTSDTKEVSFDDEGLHKVVVSATDGIHTSKKEFIVSVMKTNRAPQMDEFIEVTRKEGEKIKLTPKANDPDGDAISFNYEFPFNENGEWQSEIGDAGEYEVLVTATDGDLSSEQIVLVTLEPVNKPPVIELESPVTIKEGETITLSPKVTDPEGDEVRVTYSGWMNSNTKTTDYSDSGEHIVVVEARDSAGNEASLEITVIVQDVNRAPVFGQGSFN